ncbi:MAG: asparagine synthase (glutamine-hydrolyzing) [Dehalococcoidia bacterium]
MCGLAGVFYRDREHPVDRGLLDRMIRPLAHRGPDGFGFYANRGVGLAHSRLRIIDLQGGDQPIHNEDRTVWTVYNGEIFNYVELRAELEARGHRFYTKTDTEVIVHLYEEHGDDFVHHLNGQFAIALWDERRRRLLLVRDRPGILPLFVREENSRLLFGSEVKAILPALESSPRLNPIALDQILTFWGPASPETIFDGIEEISPGEMLIVDDSGVSRRQYWDWTFPDPGDLRQDREEALADELLELLTDSTRIRLRSDVPVGAYLSGGLDSSSIAALVRKQEDVQLRTFSITFEQNSHDESDHQHKVVQHLGPEHSTIECSGSAIAEHFPATIAATESPILRTAPVPMGILSGLVREQGYKVVLTGEGADEVLGGYDIFKEAKIRQFWARQPDSSFRPALLKRLYPYLDLNQRQSQTYLKQFFGQALESPELPYFSHVPRWTTTARTKEFLSDDLKAQLADDAIDVLMGRMPAKLPEWHPFDRAQYIEAKTLMAGYLLCSQGDRMLMRNSVEGRFPFLDHRLMEWANRLHPKHKMRVLEEKALLKRAMAPFLPPEIIARHKQPYRAPDIEAFFGSGEPPDYVMERLSSDAIRDAGYFDPGRVERLMRKVRAGRAIGAKDNMAFVGILSTQLWHHHFVGNAPNPVGDATPAASALR